MTGVTGNRLCPSAGQAGYISCCFVKEDTELTGSTKLVFIFYINFQDSSCLHEISWSLDLIKRYSVRIACDGDIQSTTDRYTLKSY